MRSPTQNLGLIGSEILTFNWIHTDKQTDKQSLCIDNVPLAGRVHNHCYDNDEYSFQQKYEAPRILNIRIECNLCSFNFKRKYI